MNNSAQETPASDRLTNEQLATIRERLHNSEASHQDAVALANEVDRQRRWLGELPPPSAEVVDFLGVP